MPVILIEGFTGTGINQAAARILYENENHEVCLNAVELDRYRGERPEVIIPLSEEGTISPQYGEIQQGKMVRLLDEPNSGAIGIVEEIHREAMVLPNGLRAKIVTIRLENNKKIYSPIVNLEILD
jgi:hypothetical protein